MRTLRAERGCRKATFTARASAHKRVFLYDRKRSFLSYKKEHPGLPELFFGAVIGVPNFFSSKFLLGALTKLPAVVVFPSFSVGTMLLVTLSGVIVFKERLSKLQWFALTTIIAALILLNI